jgi:hypothetical protein
MARRVSVVQQKRRPGSRSWPEGRTRTRARQRGRRRFSRTGYAKSAVLHSLNLVPACAPVIAPGGSPVIAPIAPTRLPAIILRILGGNAIELFRIYIGAFQTFRTTSTLRRRSFRLGSPGDHKASCRREPAHQAEQECTSFHQLFSIAPPLRQCISFVAGVEAHAWFWPR